LVDLLETLSLLKNNRFNNWRIVLNKVDTRKTVTNDVVLKSLEPYKSHILKSRIGVSETVNQCQMVGVPVFRRESKGKAAKFYERLGAELLSILIRTT